jgi:hypothetical protein
VANQEHRDAHSRLSETENLHREVDRYLEAVALFRELGHDPTWHAEEAPSPLVRRVRMWLEPCEPRVSDA